MGLWSRLRLLFQTKASSALNKVEDPREVLDYAYSEQQQLLVKLKQALVEVATSKQQLEQQSSRLRDRIPQLDSQARRAVAAGRDDLARMALERKRTALAELEGLRTQVAEVAEEERRLGGQQQQLAARIEQFRTHRDVVSARYSAAAAEVRVKESLAGVSGQLAELGLAVGRAEEKTARLQARAQAIDSLVDMAMLPGVGGGDVIESELQRWTAGDDVENELAQLKAGLMIVELPAARQEAGNDK
jgi:phage shock protein A